MSDMKSGNGDTTGKVSDQLIARRQGRNRIVPFSEIQQEYASDLPESENSRVIEISESMLIDDEYIEQSEILIDQLSDEFNQADHVATGRDKLPVAEIGDEYSLIVENTDGLSEELLASFGLDDKTDAEPKEPTHKRRYAAIAATLLITLIAYLNISNDAMDEQTRLIANISPPDSTETEQPLSSIEFASPALKTLSHATPDAKPSGHQLALKQPDFAKPATLRHKQPPAPQSKPIHPDSSKASAVAANRKHKASHTINKPALAPVRNGNRSHQPQKRAASKPSVVAAAANQTRKSGNRPFRWVWGVNLGSFPSPKLAKQEIAKLDRNGYGHEIVTVIKNRRTYYRLRIPTVKDQKTAYNIASQLREKLKFRDVWVNRYRKPI